MTRLHRIIGVVAALAVCAGIVSLSNVGIAPQAQGDAVLRVSWSARPERVETCQAQSAEAQAKLPAHMRQAVICEGVSATYRLEVRREGDVLLQELVRGGGLRHDRLLYMFREIPQPAGDATITVRLVRVESPSPANNGAQPALDANTRPDLPPSLVFEQRLHFRRGRVILVTYDPERREFVAAES